jgi:hypothetical protein
MSAEAIDYRKILIAYIDYVGAREGIDFLPAYESELEGLSRVEIAALYEAAATSFTNTDTHYVKLMKAAEDLREAK